MRTHYAWKRWFGRDAPVQVRPWSGREDRYEEHDHDFLEVTLITGGRGAQHSAQGDHPLSTGSLLVLRPGAWHAYHDCRALEGFDCCVSEGEVRRLVPALFDDPQVAALTMGLPSAPRRWGVLVTRIGPAETERCRPLLAALARLGQDASFLTERLGLFLQYAAILARAAIGRADGRSANPLHPAIAQIARLMEDDTARGWTMEELVTTAGLDASTLTRRFRRAFGLPPIAWLARRRAEQAARLLADGSLSMSEIGAQVGWPDGNYFARRFRAHLGMTPSAYRDRFRGIPEPL